MATKNWLGVSGATWTSGTSWSDGIAATATDTIMISGPSGGYQSITGGGSAAAVALLGNTALSGNYVFGALSAGQSDAPAALTVFGGSTLTATSATISAGLLQVGGSGSRFTVNGTLTIGVTPTPHSYNAASNMVGVTGGAAVQVGSLVLLANALVTSTVNVDAGSTFEVGKAGGASAGKLTIDVGQSLSGSGTLAAASGVTNQGTILAQNGTLRITGPIGGAGQIQVGATGTLDLSGATVDSAAVSFTGVGGTLVVGAYRGTAINGAALNQQGVISGFMQGDTIVFSGNSTVTSAVYSAGSNGLGTLGLLAGTTSLGFLTVAGSYAGYGFQVTPGASSFLSNITLTASKAVTGATAIVAASAGTSSLDVYAWSASGSGLWGTSAAWRDLTTGTVAVVAPGNNNVVKINGLTGTAYQVVTGPGNSASLTLVGNTTLQGSFTTGALSVGTSASAGALCIGAASGVAAGVATLMNGPLLVTGAGATLRVSGALTLGAPPTPFDYSFVSNTLTASAGALVQADNLVLQGGALVTDVVSVDATSSIEIGAQGSAALGALTVDAGKVVVGTGTLRASNGLINQGTILAQAGTLHVMGPISGTGQVQVGAGGTLDISTSASVDQEALSFTGTNGTLLLGSSQGSTVNGHFIPGLTQQGTIAGFLQGDTIAYYGQSAITGAVYQPGANGLGTLSLMSGSASLGTLTLSGDYSAYSFQVTPDVAPHVYDVTLIAIASVLPSVGTATADAYAWIGGGSGNWGDATNWKDNTTGLAASIAAGAKDLVTLAGGANQVVRGAGNSAALAITGATTLNGAFHTGSLTIGAHAASAALTVYASTTVTASAGNVVNGQLQVAGNGARLAITGTMTLGDTNGASATTALSGGGSIQTGSLVLLNGSDSVTVDATSTLEVGSAGNAAAGRLTVDAGAVLSGSGSVYAVGGIVDRGVILAQGTLSVGNAVSGLGVLQIAEGATLNVTGNTVSTAAVAFQSNVSGRNTGTLGVRSTGPASLNVQGMVSGLLLGDTISYTGATAVTNATYKSAGNGTGTLTLNGAAGVIGSLTLVGNYAGYGFQVSAGPAGTSTIGLQITDPLFDTAYYLAQNPDVAATGMDPYWHYINVGWKEGRNPDANFDTNYYLKQNPDVAAACNLPMQQGAGLNPMTHFEFNGWTEGRQPSLVFSDSAYLAANPDIKAAGINPLVHYMGAGKYEGRMAFLTGGTAAAADPLVDATFYDKQLGATIIPAGVPGQQQAAASYAATGWQNGLNPDAWFDTKYYLSHNPDIAAAHINPLIHYETQGWLEGRDPSAAFSTHKFLAAYPSVAAAHVDPLLQFVTNGVALGEHAVSV